MNTQTPMALIATILTVFIGVLHVWFLVLEMFLWRKPLGMRTFKMDQQRADTTAVLAMNQGLYNGFLAAGLFWGVFLMDAPQAYSVKVFFLVCVAIAGVFGGATVSKRIIYIQAMPAVLALLLLTFGCS